MKNFFYILFLIMLSSCISNGNYEVMVPVDVFDEYSENLALAKGIVQQDWPSFFEAENLDLTESDLDNIKFLLRGENTPAITLGINSGLDKTKKQEVKRLLTEKITTDIETARKDIGNYDIIFSLNEQLFKYLSSSNIDGVKAISSEGYKDLTTDKVYSDIIYGFNQFPEEKLNDAIYNGVVEGKKFYTLDYVATGFNGLMKTSFSIDENKVLLEGVNIWIE